jgi:hypothetical protein
VRNKNKIVNPYLFKLLKTLIAYKVKGSLTLKLSERELKQLAETKQIKIKESYIVKVFRESASSPCNFDIDTLDELVIYIGKDYGYENWEDFTQKEGIVDIANKSDSLTNCLYHLKELDKIKIINAVNKRAQQLFLSEKRKVEYGNDDWIKRVITGAEFHSFNGIIGTEQNTSEHPETSFSGKTTIILGSPKENVDIQNRPTNVIWLLQMNEIDIQKFKKGFLVFACKRYFGGLHSMKFNEKITISLNGKSIDGFNLKVIPENHSTYFHRVSPPVDFPKLAPFKDCETIYTWRLFKDRLSPNKPQILEVNIGPTARWDIDFIGIVYSFME